MGEAHAVMIMMVCSGSLRGSYIKRQVLSELFSISAVTGVIWLLLVAPLPAAGPDAARAASSVAEALTLTLFGAIICPAATSVSNGRWEAGNIARSATIGGALAALWLSWYGSQLLVNRGVEKPAWLCFGILAVTLVLYAASRRVMAALFERVLNRNILIIGDEESIQATDGQLLAEVGIRRQIEIKVGKRPTAEIPSDDILRLVAEERVNQIVVAVRDRRENGIAMSTLLELKMRGVEVSDFTKFIEHEKGRVELDGLHPGWIVYSDGFRKSSEFMFFKRAVDVLASLFVLLLSLPIMLLAAVAIKLCDPGPAIYRQKRVGFAGNVFVLYKFRSMSIGAEATGQPVWARKADPRVTPIGRFIRATRIDELPQLINVLKGEMSLVGPRPERPEFVALLRKQIEYYDLRHYILPGITGWAQINVGYTDDTIGAIRKLSYDLYYMKHASMFLDLYIFAKTLKTVLWGEGAR